MHRAILLAVVLCSLIVASSARASAQDATPAAGVVPDPSECQVDPRAADELIALWYPGGTPLAATPEGSPADVSGTALDVNEAGTPVGAVIDVPLGDPADAETIDAVTATVREVFACFNAGDFARALSLFSDNLVTSFGPEPGTSMEDAASFLQEAATPAPEDQRISLISVTNVVVMDDGRVGAIVVSNDPTVEPEGAETVLVIFVEEEGGWLVDEVIEEAVGTAPDQDSNLVATPES
jgi:ketosteroid isomerase-like protein